MSDPITDRTPRDDGLSMPAEWAPHEATLIAWPTHSRDDLWGDLFDDAAREYATVANAIAASEPVVMIVDPTQVDEARPLLASNVELLGVPIDDSWVRDSGPIVVSDGQGRRAMVDFTFNGWGGRYLPCDRDDALPAALAAHFGFPRYVAPLVLEGGAITVDGEGTVLTTASCLQNANRNPDRTQDEVERILRDYLGLDTVLWFAQGWSQSRDTDGHIDRIALFTEPGRLFLLSPSDPADPDHVLAQANREVLATTPDARGRTIEVVAHDPGQVVDIPYANVYLANGIAIVPGGAPADEIARAQVAAAFPDRGIVQVPARALHEGGGGPHCITQQIPLR
ncbi:MAG: agmatine deiminase family protein [Actinomycetota bacterium]